VVYRNIILAVAVSSPNHPVWQWLARRSGRVAGLSLELRLGMLDDDATGGSDHEANDDEPTGGADQLLTWTQPLRTLSGIPGVQLKVEWIGSTADPNHPYIAQWVKQHGQLISHLTAKVRVSEDRLKLKDFSEAAAPCRSIDLIISHYPDQVVDLTDLAPVAGSLQHLTCEPAMSGCGSLRGLSTLSSMSQLIVLELCREEFGDEEPWGSMANLTSLQQLILSGYASGDPSPLSALTGLSSLYLESLGDEADDPAPFSFSSLQALSTLQQLEVLQLDSHACAATSLQGLAGLSSLKTFRLSLCGKYLRSLEGVSPGLTQISITQASSLVNLVGMEGCTSLEKMWLEDCGVSSLQPLRGLSKIKELEVCDCQLSSLEGLNCMSLQSLSLLYCGKLAHLSGAEHFSALESLVVENCGVTSLQALSQLGEGLQDLRVLWCSKVRDEVLELPHVQDTATVHVRLSGNVKEVVLAGGVRMAVPHS
jgi:Leucine-rich repeat (LRR) protein